MPVYTLFQIIIVKLSLPGIVEDDVQNTCNRLADEISYPILSVCLHNQLMPT